VMTCSCSGETYLIVRSPTAPNSSYEHIDLSVRVKYSGRQFINSSVPLTFRYAGNPDINAISPTRIRNTFVDISYTYTVSQKTVKIVFVITSSN